MRSGGILWKIGHIPLDRSFFIQSLDSHILSVSSSRWAGSIAGLRALSLASGLDEQVQASLSATDSVR